MHPKLAQTAERDYFQFVSQRIAELPVYGLQPQNKNAHPEG